MVKLFFIRLVKNHLLFFFFFKHIFRTRISNSWEEGRNIIRFQMKSIIDSWLTQLDSMPIWVTILVMEAWNLFLKYPLLISEKFWCPIHWLEKIVTKEGSIEKWCLIAICKFIKKYLTPINLIEAWAFTKKILPPRISEKI